MSNISTAAAPAPEIIPRPVLRDTLLSATRDYPLTLLIAPPVSGKATLISQIRDAVARQPDRWNTDGGLLIVENFQSLPAPVQIEVADEIERQIAGGKRYLVTSINRLDSLFSLLRLRGQVREFGLSDLALGESEISDFMGPALAPRLSTRARHALLARTEGWVGAWNVLRSLIRAGASPADLARTFSGRDRDLVAYFDQKIAPGLSAETARFLQQIAPLERISEPIARDLTGKADASKLLDRAVSECGYFLDEDRNGDWRRPHRLFRDYLVATAQRRDPAAYRASVRRAAEDAESRADWMVAARLHSETDNVARAIEILRQYADDLITGRGDVSSFRHLTASLSGSPAHLSSLGAELALASIFAGDFAGAATLVDQTLDQVPSLTAEAQARLDAIRICIDFGLERFQRVRDEASRWLDRHPDADPRYRAIVAVALFWSCHAENDSQGAYKALGAARVDVGRARSPFLSGWLSIISAAHKLAHGQVGGAAESLGEAAGEGMIRYTADLVRAAVAWQQGRVSEVRTLVAQSLVKGARHSVTETSLMGWEAAARMAMQDEGLSSALRTLGEAESVMAARHGERARRLVRLLRSRMILQCPGETALAGLAVELESVCNDDIAKTLCRSFGETARLTLARYETRRGDPRRGISLVQPIQVAALKLNRLQAWGEASLIYAGALARLDDHKRAMRLAWPAIQQLSAGGYLAAIADEHVLLAPLLEALAAQSERLTDRDDPATRDAIRRLAARAGRPVELSPGPLRSTDDAAPVQLTDMERRVLSLAADGCSNAEIAARTLTRLTTVKWHLHNIFAKLSVRSRTAAIVQARRAGLDL